MKIVDKVWGREEWITNNGMYCGKRISLNKGAFCSLHMHPVKHETFFVESGRMRVEVGNLEPIDAIHGSVIEIKPGIFHRFAGYENTVFFEFSTQHNDDDVVRKVPSYLAPILWVFDVDGTLFNAGGPINSKHIAGIEFGILSSRSKDRSIEITNKLGICPRFVKVCREMLRKEELLSIDKEYPIRRTIYVADKNSDRQEAFEAGWQHMFPDEFVRFMESK